MVDSIAIARAPAGDEKAKKRPYSDPDGDGLIGMFMHSLIRNLGAFDCPLASAAIHLPAPIQGDGKTLASFADFFSGHVRGGNHQGPGILGQVAHFIADRVCLSVPLFFVVGWLLFFNGRVSALAR